MKKATKKLALVLACVCVMSMLLAGCGVSVSKVKGDWIVSTINDKPVDQFAQEKGYATCQVMKTVNITDDKLTVSSLAADGSVQSVSGKPESRRDGVEANIDGTAWGFRYDSKADTLEFTVAAADGNYKYVLKKGTYDLAAEYQNAVNAAQGAAAGAEEGAEAGAEEEYEEGAEEGAEEEEVEAE